MSRIDVSNMGRPEAVAAVFCAVAAMVPRTGRSHDDWLREVTARFKRAWKVIAP